MRFASARLHDDPRAPPAPLASLLVYGGSGVMGWLPRAHARMQTGVTCARLTAIAGLC